MENLFISNISSLIKILIAAPVVYLLIMVYVRFFGKRTTSQMNSFDWLVTVAMGSIAASTIILENVGIVNGALAILVLIILQFSITKSSVLSKRARKLVHSTPQLLLFEGEYMEKNLASERITKAEILAAVRESGIACIDEVYAVVLETNAKFSVIGKSGKNKSFSLADVGGLPEGLSKDLKRKKQTAE